MQHISCQGQFFLQLTRNACLFLLTFYVTNRLVSMWTELSNVIILHAIIVNLEVLSLRFFCFFFIGLLHINFIKSGLIFLKCSMPTSLYVSGVDTFL